MAEGVRRSSMRIRKRLVICFAALLASAALAVPVDASAHRGLPPFVCGTQSGGSANTFAAITAVRVGRHPGYDRFVVQFAGPTVPGYRVSPQPTPMFTLDPSGLPVTLLGHAGVFIRLEPASGMGTYGGPTDFKPRFPELREARELGDFEHVTSWGLGVTEPECMRAFTLSSPSRLVVDLET
jgi:hypothetical protein